MALNINLFKFQRLGLTMADMEEVVPEEQINFLKLGTNGIFVSMFIFFFGEELAGLGFACCFSSVILLMVGGFQSANKSITQYSTSMLQSVEQKDIPNEIPVDLSGEVLENTTLNPEQFLTPEILSHFENKGTIENLSTEDLRLVAQASGISKVEARNSNRETIMSQLQNSETARKTLDASLIALGVGGAIGAAGILNLTRKELAKKALNEVKLRIESSDDFIQWIQSAGLDIDQTLDLLDPDNSNTITPIELAGFVHRYSGVVMPSWMAQQIIKSLSPTGQDEVPIDVMRKLLEDAGIEKIAEENIDDSAQSDLDAIKLGDKLEAVVKDNPSIVAVATVTAINGREISVHFDGWNKDHDYTASLDSGMLMPSGTQASLGKELHPPYQHEGEFDWQDYLNSTGSRAAPAAAFGLQKITEDDDFEERLFNEVEEIEQQRNDSTEEVESDVSEKVEIDSEPIDDDEDNHYDEDEVRYSQEIETKVEFLIQDLQNARLRSEREQIISDFGDVHQMLICLQSKENTLMAEGDYKGGITAKAIIDGGPFEGLFVFPIQSNEILDSRKINSYLRIKCKIIDFRRALALPVFQVFKKED